MKVLPDFNYDLALEIEHLTSAAQIPEENWDDFVSFYNDYHDISKPRITTNDKHLVTLGMTLFCCAISFGFIYFLPQNKWTKIGGYAVVGGTFLALNQSRFFRELNKKIREDYYK